MKKGTLSLALLALVLSKNSNSHDFRRNYGR